MFSRLERRVLVAAIRVALLLLRRRCRLPAAAARVRRGLGSQLDSAHGGLRSGGEGRPILGRREVAHRLCPADGARGGVVGVRRLLRAIVRAQPQAHAAAWVAYLGGELAPWSLPHAAVFAAALGRRGVCSAVSGAGAGQRGAAAQLGAGVYAGRRACHRVRTHGRAQVDTGRARSRRVARAALARDGRHHASGARSGGGGDGRHAI
mmetsp:Transcript_16092/g.50004  ORF Transcript_16092/g.50004 Transcript_16092/m.50004 type:complete len:207 (+) Transcript_16092:193-813(+)